jgi:hypothetical protein
MCNIAKIRWIAVFAHLFNNARNAMSDLKMGYDRPMIAGTKKPINGAT